MDWIFDRWAWIRQHEELVGWVVALSFVSMAVSIIAMPMIIRRIPSDYFLDHSPRTEAMRQRHPVWRVLFLVIKNFVGILLVIGGILLLLTPGQGLLTILLGVLLMNFPGKREFEIRVIRWRPLNRAANWIRRRAGKRPLELP